MNCVQRSIHCMYNQAALPQVADSTSSSPLNTLSPMEMLDLELLHHWSSHTCYTLSQEPSSQTCWRVTIPRIGFSFDFVLHGLFAISALHLARCTPDRRQFYTEKSRWYWESGLGGASEALANPGPGSSDALYAFAVASCFYALAKGPKPGDLLVCTNEGVADWLILFRGVRSLVELSDMRVLEGPLAPLSTCALLQVHRFSNDHSPQGECMLVEELKLFVDEICADDPNFPTYSAAVEGLSHCFNVVHLEEKSGRGVQAANVQAFIWLYRISDDFVLCLQQRLPMALVIYAHFVVLAKRMDWTWIMEGWIDHLVSEIYDSLSQEWRVWLQRPLDQIGGFLSWDQQEGELVTPSNDTRPLSYIFTIDIV